MGCHTGQEGMATENRWQMEPAALAFPCAGISCKLKSSELNTSLGHSVQLLEHTFLPAGAPNFQRKRETILVHRV